MQEAEGRVGVTCQSVGSLINPKLDGRECSPLTLISVLPAWRSSLASPGRPHRVLGMYQGLTRSSQIVLPQRDLVSSYIQANAQPVPGLAEVWLVATLSCSVNLLWQG